MPRRGVVPKFSDLEVIALALTAETESIDSENRLFSMLKSHRELMPNLISRQQYNDRRKYTAGLCEDIRKRLVAVIDGGEDYFCIDSKPIEVCRLSRGKRCRMGRTSPDTAPNFGYYASQGVYYFGYKLHALTGLNGVVHSYDLSKESVHDLHYLNDIKPLYHDCSIFGDKGYISESVQLDLFETANITSGLNARTVSIKRHGNRHSYRLPRRGSVSRRCSRSCATNTWSSATMQNKPMACLPALSAKSVH